jgi:hypothetical protein
VNTSSKEVCPAETYTNQIYGTLHFPDTKSGATATVACYYNSMTVTGLSSFICLVIQSTYSVKIFFHQKVYCFKIVSLQGLEETLAPSAGKLDNNEDAFIDPISYFQ